jgi:hypothetical protein
VAGRSEGLEICKVNDLINQPSQQTGLPEDEAKSFVDVVIKYLEAKVPGPVASQIDQALNKEGTSLADRVSSALGRK